MLRRSSLALLPLFWFSVATPFLANHRSIDLSIIALLLIIFSRSAERSASAQSRAPAPDAGRSLPHFVWLSAVLIVCACLRFFHLDYNGPFIDELLNTEVKSIGNEHFIASDTRFWPVLGFYASRFWGVPGMRAVNCGIGVLTILLLSCVAAELTPEGEPARKNLTRVSTALLFGISPAALFISEIGTHDALALCFFTAGLLTLLIGCKGLRIHALLWSAFFFTLSFASRYFILTSFSALPFFFLLLHRRPESQFITDGIANSWFIRPLLAFFGIYALFNATHIVSSVQLAVNQSGSAANGGFSIVAAAMLMRLLIVLLPIAICGLLTLPFRSRLSPGERMTRRFLWASFLVLPAIHLLKSSDYGMEKNLSYAILFGAPLAALHISFFAEQLRLRGAKVAVTIPLLFVVCGSLLWKLSLVVFPYSTRPEVHSEPILAELRDHPVRGSLFSALRYDQSRWYDPAPVMAELERLGLGHQRASIFGLYGGTHINWFLTHAMGRRANGEYYVSPASAWSSDPFLDAFRNRHPLIIAVIPEAELAPYERMRDYPGFFFESAAQIITVPGTYGRVLVFVCPEFLDLDSVALAQRAYWEARVLLSRSVEEAITAHDLEAALSAISKARTTGNTGQDPSRRFAIELAAADAYARIGFGREATDQFRSCESLAGKSADPNLFMNSVTRRKARAAPFRLKVDHDSANERVPGQNLLALGKSGELALGETLQTTGRARWIDFDPPVVLPENTVLDIETTLEDGDALAARLVEKDQDFAEKGLFIRLPFSAGRQRIRLRNTAARSIKRFDLQFGPTAWGPLGGTMDARVTLHALSVSPDDGTVPYGAPLPLPSASRTGK